MASGAGHPAAAGRVGLRRREIVLGAILAGTSGAAVLAEAFGLARMSFTVPFFVLPASSLLVGVVLARRGLYGRLHHFSTLLLVGAGWGLVATLGYDAVRPVLVGALGLAFDPYRAIGIFGALITGLPAGDAIAGAVGWLYHFWNGISFAIVFALARPSGGVLPGLAWALGLQVLMMAAYPSLLQARLDDPGFLATGIVGHSIWGIVLGSGVAWWSARA